MFSTGGDWPPGICKSRLIIMNDTKMRIIVTIEGTVITFTETHGHEIGERQQFDVAKLPQTIKDYMLMDRAKAKLVDCYADEKGGFHDKLAHTNSVWHSLMAGEWTRGRQVGSSDLITALMEVTGEDEATVVEAVNGYSKAEKDAKKKHPAVKAIMTRLAAERAAKRAADAESKTGDDIEPITL